MGLYRNSGAVVIAAMLIAPGDMFPQYLRRKGLLDAIEKILGPETIVTGRVQVRYASQWDLSSRKSMGLPKSLSDEAPQD